MHKIEPAQFEDLFERRLERYDPDRAMIAEEQEEQEEISSRLKEANASFLHARRGDSSTHEREQALQKLENAYNKYKETVSNLDVGRKFYNDLAKIVSRFRDDCRNFAYQRRTEAGQLEAYVLFPFIDHVSARMTDCNSDLTNAMSSLNLSQANSLQQEKLQEGLRAPYKTKAAPDEPLMAPTPQRALASPPLTPGSAGISAGIWQPERGIQFAGAPPPQTNGDSPALRNPNTRTGQAKSGQWDPSRGFHFG